MSSAFEAMGMSLPIPPQWQLRMQKKADSAEKSAFVLVSAIQTAASARFYPRFENAISVIMAVGGSTNAVLHMLAIAHAAGVELSSMTLKLFAPVSQSYAIPAQWSVCSD